MAIQDHLPVRRHALLPLHAGQLHRPPPQLGAVPGRFRILRSPLRQHLPKGTIQCFTTEVGLDSRHTRTGIQNKHEQERMYGHILVLSKTLTLSPYFTPLPPFLLSQNYPLHELSSFIFFIFPMGILVILYIRMGLRIRQTSEIQRNLPSRQQQHHNGPTMPQTGQQQQQQVPITAESIPKNLGLIDFEKHKVDSPRDSLPTFDFQESESTQTKQVPFGSLVLPSSRL